MKTRKDIENKLQILEEELYDTDAKIKMARRIGDEDALDLYDDSASQLSAQIYILKWILDIKTGDNRDN